MLANMMVVLEDTEAAAQHRAAALDALVPSGGQVARFVGTPDRLADTLLTWHRQDACDGLNVLPAVLPIDLDRLVDAVVPRLRRLGLFRDDYTGGTLREHLGLSRPCSRYAAHLAEREGS